MTKVLTIDNGKMTMIDVTDGDTSVGGVSANYVFLPTDVVGGCDANGN